MMDVGGVVSILVFNLDTTAISIVFVHILVTFHLLSMLRSGVEFVKSVHSKSSKKSPDAITQLSSVRMENQEEE